MREPRGAHGYLYTWKVVRGRELRSSRTRYDVFASEPNYYQRILYWTRTGKAGGDA